MKKYILSVAAALLCVVSCQNPDVRIETAQGTMILTPLSDNAVRVRLAGDLAVPELDELVYTQESGKVRYKVSEDSAAFLLSLPEMSVRYDKGTGLLTFLDAGGNEILRETEHSVDASQIGGVPCYNVSQTFYSPEDEHLYGTGQFQDGYLDIRGLTRRLTQVNTQISIPYVLSSKGYALLWNNYGLTDFNPALECVVLEASDTDSEGQTVNATGTSGNRRETRWFSTFASSINVPEDGTYSFMLDVDQKMARKLNLVVDGKTLIDINNVWLPPTGSVLAELEAGEHSIEVTGTRGDSPRVYFRKVDNTTSFHSPVATALDYTVFAGTADECIASYRSLTGPVPHMQDWMFGYIHCRERYTSSDDILANAAGFRERNLPLDVIVQDWQWWGKYGWNALRFDEDYYPDPLALTDSLHKDDVHLMLSVWSKVDRGSEAGKALDAAGCYIDGTDWIDFFKPEAADFYLRNFCDSLCRFGIDAWWFDATEPENDDLMGRRVGNDSLPGEFYRNVYPMMVNSTMHRGLKDRSEGEPVILTRSAFSGMQRYGVVTWSGDVGNDFGTLRRQIAGGLGQMASGLPWWTYDAGGFFRPSDQYSDEAYQERMLRWLQVAVYLPFMRVHGYMSQTEPWRYSERTQEIFRSCIERRKALQPYIIEQARKVSEEGYTLMRPLVFDFPDDEEALRQDCEFMFGSDYLVCPVLEAGVIEWTVYLPVNEAGWEYTTAPSCQDAQGVTEPHGHYAGGQYVTVPVTLDDIPVFKRLQLSPDARP